ncbi:MAG: hypothetical protein JOZ55_11565, partial [Alphaproteobacteria bacterium]|nr:hypothetical protein [Alphaproteobacteria bacterium]
MALKIVGSGLGRTGTASLKEALETLGFPCHHMIEVFMHPESVPLWVEAANGHADWDAIYRDYTATVDYPGAAFWRELVQKYPSAKVLHSVRDPDQWFESTQATIFRPGGPMDAPPGPVTPLFAALRSRISVDIHDRAAMVAYFRRHSEEVEREVPRERLLVYNANEGWEPLCKFL